MAPLRIVHKNLDAKLHLIIFALPNKNGALVKGLRRLPFTEESRVRFPYVLQEPLERVAFLCLNETLWFVYMC